MLIPIKYHSRKYPDHITPEILEIAGHFDTKAIRTTHRFSLHTEYSYGTRKLDTELICNFPAIVNASKFGVPQLWFSKQWALEFADFVKKLCGDTSPEIIEIHPPFSDYTLSIADFLKVYCEFESRILAYYPSASILIENRSGTTYKGGRFVITRGKDIRTLCELIASDGLALRITLDLPQLLTAYGGPQKLSSSNLFAILNRQNAIQAMTRGIHLWGKRRSPNGRTVSHAGDLDSYFESRDKKEVFLKWLKAFLSDGSKRYFVPEVNSSNEDLQSIVRDLESSKIGFN